MIPASLLAAIPGCEDGRPPDRVTPLPGGRGCNLVLQLKTKAGRFVLRLRQQPLNRPGAAAATELLCQRAAAAAGIAPGVIQAATDGSWILMEYVDAPVWTATRLLSVDGALRIGAQLARLHALQPPAIPEFDAKQIAEGYMAQLEESCASPLSRHRALAMRVAETSRRLVQFQAPAVLNHGDLQPGNLLGDEPILVDWEYAQLVDPTYDMACLLTYYPGLEAHRDLLLHAAGLDSRRHAAALALQQERFACLNQLWEAVNSLKAG